MTRPEEGTITVADEGDAVLAGRQTKSLLEDIEFDDSTTEDVVLVVHELVSNIVQHAGEGRLTLEPRSDGAQSGIVVHARDSGPGIVDINQALVDGYSTAGGLGGGLGTVSRLMDNVIIDSGADSGNGVEIMATRWDREPTSIKQNPPVGVGAATRAKPGEDQNGDTFLIEHGRGKTLVGVIDGLGHGQSAHRASRTARQYIQTHSTDPLPDLFAGVERVCHNTRGVVMLLGRFDWHDATVTLGSVGNITLRTCKSETTGYLPPVRGVLGANASSPQIRKWDWDPASVMVVHSDGLISELNCEEPPLSDDTSATDAATELLQTFSDQGDDATVLVVKGLSND